MSPPALPEKPTSEARDLTFAYGAGEPIVNGFSLGVPNGDNLAIVGPSGIGKSTLAALLAGVLRPDSGAITVDGKPCFLRSDRPRLVTMVPQESYVFAGSLRENLFCLRPSATDQGQICYLLGRVNAWEGDVKPAFKWFEKAVEADSASADYQYRLGQMYGLKAQEANIFRKPGHARGARKAFEKAVRLDPDHLDARTALVEYHLYAPGFLGGSREKALEQADEIKSRNPTEGHLAWGLIHAEEKAQAKREGAYLAAVESANDDVRPVISLAALYLRTGRRLEAIRVYETYLRSYSDQGPILYRLSNLYRLEKENVKAFEAARRSLEVATDSLATLVADSNPTVQSFENALSAQMNRLDALYAIGRFSALTGIRVDLGLESVMVYLRQLPERWRGARINGYYRLGRIHVRRGERDIARDAYRQVLKLDKEHKGARKALEELD